MVFFLTLMTNTTTEQQLVTVISKSLTAQYEFKTLHIYIQYTLSAYRLNEVWRKVTLNCTKDSEAAS